MILRRRFEEAEERAAPGRALRVGPAARRPSRAPGGKRGEESEGGQVGPKSRAKVEEVEDGPRTDGGFLAPP